MIFEVGKSIPALNGVEDGIRTSFDDSGAVVIVAMRGITDTEEKQFRSGANLKIGYFSRNGIMLMLYKFGNLQWMDSPYDPHIGKMPHFEPIEDGKAVAFTIVLVETNGGIVKQTRLVSPSTEFSGNLVSAICSIAKLEFDERIYNVKLARAFEMYTTNDMVDAANKISKVREK